jgi:type II secretory pathway component PulC
MIGARTAERAIQLCGIVTLALCGVLATKAVSHVRSAEPDPVRRSPSLTPEATGSAAKPAPVLSKDGSALVARNPFCHDCAPAGPGPRGPVGDPRAGIPMTELPLQLLAISKSERAASSFISVRHRDGRQGAYWIGDRLPGAGPVVRIGGQAVVFRNPSADRLEKLALIPPSKVTRKPETPTSSAGASVAGPSPVRSDGANSYVVDRGFVTRMMNNPAMMRRPPRVRPWTQNGEVKGLTMYGIGSRSLFGQLGFRNGDKLMAVNGHSATSLNALIDIYGKVKRSDHFTVSLQRRGRPVTLSYRIE